MKKPAAVAFVVAGSIAIIVANVKLVQGPAAIVACPLAHPGVTMCVNGAHLGSHGHLPTAIESTTTMLSL